VTFREALRQGAAHPLKPVPITHDDLAYLQYTGGTTGVAKGAMLTHGNIIANLQQAHAWISPYVKEGEELIVTALPLYHIFSLTANCLTFFKIGASNLLITNPGTSPASWPRWASIRSP
jgi:long-chain acyl-CoA synthetase